MSSETRREIEESGRRAFESYEKMLEQGVAKEVARTVLPLATYTKYYWSCNPRSLMHFCSLRNHEAAQFEIRQYAAAAETFLEQQRSCVVTRRNCADVPARASSPEPRLAAPGYFSKTILLALYARYILNPGKRCK